MDIFFESIFDEISRRNLDLVNSAVQKYTARFLKIALELMMNFYKETPEDRLREKEALEKQIREAIRKDKITFKEWWLKPVALEVSKWAIIGILALLATLCWPYIAAIFSKL
jgi:hypothetical protein